MNFTKVSKMEQGERIFFMYFYQSFAINQQGKHISKGSFIASPIWVSRSQKTFWPPGKIILGRWIAKSPRREMPT